MKLGLAAGQGNRPFWEFRDSGPCADQVPQACRVDHPRDEHGLPAGACYPPGPGVSARHKGQTRFLVLAVGLASGQIQRA